MTVIGEFVKRQVRESEFSHYDGTWDELLKVIEDAEASPWVKYIPGYRDGVRLLRIPPQGFLSSVVPMTPEITFEDEFKPRRPGEQPVRKRVAFGNKIPAKTVEIVLYHSSVLREDPLNTIPDGDFWEVVSINANGLDYPVPMTPMTMARNMAELPGGTKGTYTAEQFVQAILFWNSHIQVREK